MLVSESTPSVRALSRKWAAENLRSLMAGRG
jgi:hypothetical protein